LEKIATAAPAAIFVDYAHTPDALINVLKTLRPLAAGRLLVVFGCGGDRDRAKRPLMGAACAAHADHLIVTSDNPRSEKPSAIIADITAGIPATCAHEVCVDRRAAIAGALRQGRAGDVILVAGKGHEAVQILATRRIPFDDRTVIKQLGAELYGEQ